MYILVSKTEQWDETWVINSSCSFLNLQQKRVRWRLGGRKNKSIEAPSEETCGALHPDCFRKVCGKRECGQENQTGFYHLPLLLQSLGVKWRHLGSMGRWRFCIALSCPSTMSSERVRIYWPWETIGREEVQICWSRLPFHLKKVKCWSVVPCTSIRHLIVVN